MNLVQAFLNPIVAGSIVCIAALTWRAFCLFQLAADPLLPVPLGQNAVLADQTVSSGNWLGWPPLGPLYSYVLRLGQGLPGEGYLGLKWVQALVGSLSSVLVWRLGRGLFGPWVGLSAGLLAAFYAPSLYWEGQLNPAIWASTCALGGVVLLGTGQRPLLAGLFFGVAVGLETKALGLALAAIGWLVWGSGAGSRQGAVVFAGACLVGILPALVWNGGWHWLPTIQGPENWPQALYRFWHGSELTSQADPYLSAASGPGYLLWAKGIFFPFGLVGPLALLGLYGLWRQGQRASLLLWAVAAGMGGALLQGGDGAARALLIPILLVLAAEGGASWPRVWRDRQHLSLQAVFTVVLLLVCNMGNGPQQGTANQHYWRGYAFEQLDMKANAVREYEQALSLGKTSAEVYGALGRLYHQERQFNRSISAYEDLLQLEPDRTDARAALAQVYLLSEQPRQAAAHYEELSRDGTGLFSGRLGDARLMAGDIQGALNAYKTMSTAHPDSNRVLYNMARLYETEGFSKEAVETYLRLEQYPEWKVEANWRAAALLREPEEQPRAEQLLRTALAVAPDNRPALWELGQLLVRADRYQEALPIFEKLQAQDPADYRIYFFLSKTYFRLERSAEAERAYAKYQMEKRRTEVQQSAEEEIDDMLRQFGELGQ